MKGYKKRPNCTFLIMLLAFFSACSEKIIEPEPQYYPDWTEIRGKSEFNSFYDINFTNDNYGLIAGSSGALLKTTDGGYTWRKMDVGTEINLSLTSILDENIFATAGNSLFVTTDQGNSFSEILALQNRWISDIHFINKQLWYIVKSCRVYKTIDGGLNWDLVYETVLSYLYKMHFIYRNTFYVFGGFSYHDMLGKLYSSGFLSKTTDGGDTWVEFQDSLLMSAELTAISFINDNVGYVGNVFHEILKTTDGGYNWTYINSPDFYTRKLLFINEHLGYCPSGKKLYKTTDGGYNWEVDLDLDSLQSNIEKIVNTPNYLYVLNREGRIFKKSIYFFADI